MQFLENKDLLSSKQIGSRSCRSTEDQPLLTYVGIIIAVERGCLVDMIYLDFCEAFDLVNHEILLMKLSCQGFQDQVSRWWEEFSCNRLLYVPVAGPKIDEETIKSGIPQEKCSWSTVVPHLR